MNKKELLAKIKEALTKEELAIPIYTSHIEGTLFWSGLDKNTKAKLIEYLKTLAKESEGHVKLLQRILEIYQ